MPSGSLPTYAYRPPARPGVPARIRVCSSRRSRLFEGGTYFRAREPGLKGNNIFIEVLEVSPTEAYCIVWNKNLKFDENITGPGKINVLDLKGDYSDLWKIDELDTNTPRTQYYSISVRIAFSIQENLPYVLPGSTEIPDFKFNKLFVQPGKIAVQVSKKTENLTSSDVISITPRYRIYQLSLITKDTAPAGPPPPLPGDPPPIPGAPPGPHVPSLNTGWDIDNLREQINAADPWVQMMKRSVSKAPLPQIPFESKYDAQDNSYDADFLLPFNSTPLRGGDGLPDNPNNEKTGLFRSLVHVNYGEQPNGKLAEHNTVYEWVGDNSISGLWKPY